MMVLTKHNDTLTQHLNSPTITKVVLVVEYDGTAYHGSQLQSGVPTIQSEIESAIYKLTGEKIRILAASRTDAGVHARGQVVSFRTNSQLSTHTFINGLNYYLPTDIAVKEAYRTNESFDVRRHALKREYKYYILNRSTRSPLYNSYTYHVPGTLNIEAMNQVCQTLIGKHDLASFASCTGQEIRNYVRTIYKAEVTRAEEMVTFTIVANSFLPHQVRNTIGSLVRIGLGRMNIDEFNSVISATQPGLAGPSAPASGLYLMHVQYPCPIKEYTYENI